MAEPTLAELITSVRREIAMRRRAYPRWVTDGRMIQAKADHEIAAMESALRMLEAVRDGDIAELQRHSDALRRVILQDAG